eukprot:scaffold2579_cov356-Prasinococcus_capsulatus_cf.AAC.7
MTLLCGRGMQPSKHVAPNRLCKATAMKDHQEAGITSSGAECRKESREYHLASTWHTLRLCRCADYCHRRLCPS